LESIRKTSKELIQNERKLLPPEKEERANVRGTQSTTRVFKEDPTVITPRKEEPDRYVLKKRGECAHTREVS